MPPFPNARRTSRRFVPAVGFPDRAPRHPHPPREADTGVAREAERHGSDDGVHERRVDGAIPTETMR